MDASNAWILAGSKACSDIVLNCRGLQIQLVHLLPTSKPVWDTLQATYDHVDLASQIMAQTRLVTLQLCEGKSLPDFIHQWQAMLDQIVSAALVVPPSILNK